MKEKLNSCYLLLNILLPFEPTLFPKLQVYFADFPYLRYANNHQRLLTLRTWCGYRYEMLWKWIWIFFNNTSFFKEQ